MSDMYFNISTSKYLVVLLVVVVLIKCKIVDKKIIIHTYIYR